jgi:hypothetical protein
MRNFKRTLCAAFVVAAPLLVVGTAPASAWGWYGYRGCGYGYYAPRVYGYAYRSYYRPRFMYGGFYRPRVFGWRGWYGRGWRRW